MKCEDCKAYRAKNDIEGECMLYPPVPNPAENSRVTPDAWVRPLVYMDDFCGEFKQASPAKDDFPADKIVDPVEPTRTSRRGKKRTPSGG